MLRAATSAFSNNISRRNFLPGLGLGITTCVGGSYSRTILAAEDTPTRLVAAPAQVPLLAPDYEATAVWAYGASVPGPLLRARAGEELHVQLVNQLPAPTTVHWHGVRIENAMDGVAGLTQEPVAPGETFDYRFTVPDAGTYWYHPHHRSWEQVARGLYGVLIVDEAEPPEVDRDITLVFDDWRVDDTGQIHEASFGSMHDHSHAGRLGNVLTVNGESFPELSVRKGERVRLRLLNTANARVMTLRLEGHTPTLLSVDGQPVEPRALASDRITLAPGQRADLIVDMEHEPGQSFDLTIVHRDRDVSAARFVYADQIRPPTGVSKARVALQKNALQTPDYSQPEEIDLRVEGGAMGRMRAAVYKGRELDMRALVERGMVWALNGTAGRPESPLFDVPRGRTVVIRLHNEGRWPHAMHFHGHHVLEIEKNGQPVAYTQWRDTVLLEGDETQTVAFVADNPGRWMIHCHMLEHQASGMATWFRVQA